MAVSLLLTEDVNEGPDVRSFAVFAAQDDTFGRTGQPNPEANLLPVVNAPENIRLLLVTVT
jgi:hypothetical protein